MDEQLSIEVLRAFEPLVAKYADPDEPHPLRAFDVLLWVNGQEHRFQLNGEALVRSE